MANRCEVCGKGPAFGRTVSHAHNVGLRRFNPNIQAVKALINGATWQVSSIIGILLASLFPDSWGLALAGTLALIPVMIATINSRSTLMAVVVAAVVALL